MIARSHPILEKRTFPGKSLHRATKAANRKILRPAHRDNATSTRIAEPDRPVVRREEWPQQLYAGHHELPERARAIEPLDPVGELQYFTAHKLRIVFHQRAGRMGYLSYC